MKAITVKKENGKPLLLWEEVPDIQCNPQEVLVDVKATAVNRADLLQALGLYPPPPGESEILGLEMAGVIAAVGDEVRSRHIGDRVLVFPSCIGSTHTGLVLLDLVSMGRGPAALVVQKNDSLLISGVVFASGIGNLPISLDPSAWWSRGSWICLALILALAVWAFRTALGGRAVLADP